MFFLLNYFTFFLSLPDTSSTFFLLNSSLLLSNFCKKGVIERSSSSFWAGEKLPFILFLELRSRTIFFRLMRCSYWSSVIWTVFLLFIFDEETFYILSPKGLKYLFWKDSCVIFLFQIGTHISCSSKGSSFLLFRIRTSRLMVLVGDSAPPFQVWLTMCSKAVDLCLTFIIFSTKSLWEGSDIFRGVLF